MKMAELSEQDLIDLAFARRLAASGHAKWLRKTARLSGAEVADAIGAAYQSVYACENGRRPVARTYGPAWGRLLRRLMDEGKSE